MPLIYLDTSHIAVLTKARTEAPARFAAFLETWRAIGATLAFSRSHLVEIRRHGDPTMREARYQLLEELLPIRSDIVFRTVPREYPLLLTDREILRAGFDKGLIGVTGDDAAAYERALTDPFPEIFASPADLAVLRSFEDTQFGGFVGLIEEALKTGAEAQRREKNTPYQRTRISEMPDTLLTPEQVTAAEEAMDAAFAEQLSDGGALARIEKLLPAGAVKEILEQQLAPLRRMARRAGEVGPRRAYAEAIGMTGDPSGDRRHLDQIGSEQVFASQVTTLGREFLGVSDPRVLAALSRAVTLVDAPGTWLGRAVELELRTADTSPAPSDAFDLEHIAFLPYVDRLFADKRIATYAAQALKRSGAPAALASVAAPRTAAASIDAIETAIAAS